VAFDHDCREGICGMCSLHINGHAHGPEPDRPGAPLGGGPGGRRKYPSAAAISPVRAGEADAGR